MFLNKKPNQQTKFKDLFYKGDFEGLEKLHDATLETEDGSKFQVHRFLLASRNDYFSDLFCKENTKNKQFTIPHINAETLDQILVYLYTGEICLTDVNVADVWMASNFLLVVDLTRKCQEFASRNINIGSCLPLFIVAWQMGKQDFVNWCYRYVQVHFEEVLRKTGNTIGRITLEALKKFLEDRNLNATSERVAWMAIVKWVEDNQQERLPYVPELLGCLYLDIDESLEIDILEHTLVKNNHYFKDTNVEHLIESPGSDDSLSEAFAGLFSENYSNFNDAYTGHKKLLDQDDNLESQICKLPPQEINPNMKDLNTEQQTKLFLKSTKQTSNLNVKRIPAYMNFVAFYRVINENSHIIQLYLTYDDQLDIWHKVGEIDFWPDSLLRINQRVYMFNSLEDRRVSFDVCSGSFKDLSPMSIPRLHYRVVSLEGSIYALGGGTEEDETTSVFECYDPETDSWSLRLPMVPMILSEVVAMDGRIFAIGRDDDGLDSEMKTQVYDIASDSWSLVAPPTVYRRQFASAIFEGKLYTIGGHDFLYESLENSEVYDPSTDVWTVLPNLPFAFIGPKAVVFKQKLIVYEDLYKDMSYGNPHPPVSWNSDENMWEDINQNLINIYLYQFCVIEEQDILQELIRKYRSSDVQWLQSFLN